MLASALVIAACNATPTAIPTPAPAVPTVAPASPTPLPATVRLLHPDSSNDPLTAALTTELENLAAASSLVLDQTPHSAAPVDTATTRIVIALDGIGDMASLVADNPGVQFVTIGITDPPDAPNLFAIGPQGPAWDRQGFAAGYAAALATPAYRVGALAPQGIPAAEAAAAAFQQGAVFYCGLCNPVEPPYVDYPLLLPVAADGSDLAAAISSLAASGTRAVYVPDVQLAQAALPLAAQSGMLVIGPALVDDAFRPSWLLTVRADPIEALRTSWPALLAGMTTGSAPMSIVLDDIRPESFSPGKLALLEETLQALDRGIIAVAPE